MKRLLFLFSVLLLTNIALQAQNNYEAQWRAIDALLKKKNLPKSALSLVKKIYTSAKKEGNNIQVLKSLVYQIDLQDQIRENNELAAIAEVEKELAASREPFTSVLNSLLAGLYLRYFEDHRWQLYNRTLVEKGNTDSIVKWSTDDFHQKISSLYLASVQQKEVLQQTSLDAFAAVLVKGNVSKLRPTLYDLLVHKALDYFESDEQYITKPEYNFELSDPALFAPIKSFVALAIKTEDTSSLHYKALRIYQELLAFHLADKRKDALIDADIRRLHFVNQYAVGETQDTLYKQALENLLQEYGDNKATNQAGYLLTVHYNNLAESYRPAEDTAYRYERIKAEKMLEKIVSDSTEKNEGWVNSYNLLQEIRKPFLSVVTEKVNLPGEPFRALVNYRNVPQVTVQIIPSSQNLRDLLDATNADYWKVLAKQKPLKQWEQTLPATNDLQQHAVEIKLEALPAGEYMAVLSDGDNIGAKTVTATVAHFWVSTISYLNRDNDFFVLHRKTGQPLAGAEVVHYETGYNEKQSRTSIKIKGRYTTNTRGFFRIRSKNVGPDDSYMTIRYKGETLSLNENLYLDNNNNERREQDATATVFFFTDRSLYRPGQTVQFKGILIREGKRSDKTILPNQTTTVYLFDANEEKRDSLQLTSNEYGSIAGKFSLPPQLLNGSFSIRAQLGKKWSETSFSVEEYKRPKFYVSFDKVKQTYKLGDSVRLKITAKAYAGNDIGGAKVSYRVTRNRSLYYAKRWHPSRTQQLAHGETETSPDGTFFVSFVAEPDRSIDSTENPVFNYAISATITDLNGETQSGTESVSIGYASLLLSASAPEKLPVDSFKKLSVETRNLEGEFVEAPITAVVYKLSPEKRLIRTRFWDRPDQFVMSKEEYLRYFPFDEYNNETDYKTWPKEAVDSFSAKSSEAGSVFINLKKALAAGHYLVLITARDKSGKELWAEVYVELFAPNKLSKPEFLWVYKQDKEVKPGDETDVTLATSAKDIYLIKEADRQNKNRQDTTRFAYEEWNNGERNFAFGADEKDRGGYNYAFFFVKENRVYHDAGFIHVPWSNKELTVDITTFRDKTEPGTKETWKVKIRGEGAKKVAAEMLASMYDASFDNLHYQPWEVPFLWPTYEQNLTWADEDFRTTGFDNKQVELKKLFYQKTYDAFLFEMPSQPLWWLNRYRHGFDDYGLLSADTSAVADPNNPSKVLKYVVTRSYDMGGDLYIKANHYPSYLAAQMERRETAKFADAIVVADAKGKRSGTYVFEKGGEASEMIPELITVQPRKNLAETAFFFPLLTTDENGDVELSFTAPEALTKWKLQTFAHTKDLAFGLAEKTMLTQKSLMVQPNVPRFVRQQDTLTLQAKIANLSDSDFEGKALLQLFDAATNEPVDAQFTNAETAVSFSVKAGEATVVNFPVNIPQNFNSSLTWRITASAKGGDKNLFTDGEEASLPVLPNTVLLTETVPVVLKGNAIKEVRLDKLLQSVNSPTIRHQSLTIEATSNPAWYVVQALPYLMEFPYECAEQTWNRFYANALASAMATSSPHLQQLFERWRKDSTALLSNLQKNEELKSALLQETPWLLEAKSETAQKRNIALLFDPKHINSELVRNMAKLKQMQKSNGAFPWFPGGPDNRYITQYILTGMGRLTSIKGFNKEALKTTEPLITKALHYLDAQVEKDYKTALKQSRTAFANVLSSEEIQYLYMWSYFPQYSITKELVPAVTRLQKMAKVQWMKQPKQMQAMIALALYRNGDKKTPAAILASLKETAIVSEDRGMYWKEVENRFYWQDAPIETMALLIEVFGEASNDQNTVTALQTWLIQNKQTNNWGTTKATADACFAILKQHSFLKGENAFVSVTMGASSSKPVVFNSASEDLDEGTGYFKRTISADKIRPDMGMIAVETKSLNKTLPVWVNVYWQYFENLNNITETGTPLHINKEIFLEQTTDKGMQLIHITDTTTLKRGDKLKIRLHVITDRGLQYVHLKDLRASCMEPLEVISGYRFQNVTSYYQETKDASTNFFFDDLPKGTYVFEYPVYVAQSGRFQDGIASVQCMYAPQFAAYSKSSRVEVRK